MLDTENKLSVIIKACEEKKGIDTKVLNISELTPIADYFVIVSGNSSAQVMSIADEVEKKVFEAGYTEISKEGYQSGRWILMDLDDIIVHVFHKEEREYYNLERLWSNKKEKLKEEE